MDYISECIKNSTKKMLASEKKRVENYKRTINAYKTGRLVVRNRDGKTYYSEVIGKNEFGITKNSERLQEVINGSYIKSALYRAEQNILILERTIKSLDKVKPKELYYELNLEESVKGNYNPLHYKWMKADYETNTLYPERLKYKTMLGTIVRSKSEANIANSLESLGIPYRYEQKIYINGKYVYPDFTIMLPNENVLLWEHNGLMDDVTYAERAYFKIKEYETAGFRQHTNLIVTYEDDIRSPDQIEEIIKRFILF